MILLAVSKPPHYSNWIEADDEPRRGCDGFSMNIESCLERGHEGVYSLRSPILRNRQDEGTYPGQDSVPLIELPSRVAASLSDCEEIQSAFLCAPSHLPRSDAKEVGRLVVAEGVDDSFDARSVFGTEPPLRMR
ncbi:hypothetical protein [Microbacterium sp.]|uniref:hypothetical protein n=1 Tax=Microbacterium sp. TaxID=51671 RepID=UPI0035663D3C